MIRRILPKAYAALLLWLGSAPLFLLPAAALVPGRVWLGLLLPVPAILLTAGAGLLKARRRAAGLLLAILLVATLCALLFIGSAPLGMLLFLPCLLVMLTFMPAMARPAHQEWTVTHFSFGVVVHIVAQFLKGVEALKPAATPLTWIFTAYIVGVLFSVNRLVLMGNTPASVKPLLPQNRVLLVIVCLLALLLANLKAIAAAVRAAIAWIVTAVMQVAAWIAALFPGGSQSAGTSGIDLSGLAGVEESSPLAHIFEIIFAVVAALIIAVALYFAFKHLLRALRRLYRRILERLQLYRRKIAADYVDQSESLLDWGELREAAKSRVDRFRKRYLPTPWEKLSPAERVRRVYALLLRRPAAPDPALTAQEMVQSGALKLKSSDDAASLAALYDQARYSTHPIAETDADNLRKRTGV